MSSGSPRPSFFRRYGWVIAGLLIAFGIVVFLAPRASQDPDGLDRVAQDQGFADSGRASRFEFLPDYSVPGIEDEQLGTIISGIAGVAIVFGLVMAFGLVTRARKGPADESRSLPREE